MKNQLALFLLITSFSCFSARTLSATTTATVTASTDNGTEAAGTFSSAISNINTALGGTIDINIASFTITADMPSITQTLTIEGDTGGSTINGEYSSINVTGGITTLNSDVTLSNTLVSITGETAGLEFQGPSNWNSLTSVELATGGTVGFFFLSNTTSSQETYLGDVSVSTAGSILLGPLTSSTAPPTLTLTGLISESTTGSIVTFEPVGSIVLSNTSSTNSWTGGTVISGVGAVIIDNSNSFPTTGPISILDGQLTFNLGTSGTYTTSASITGNQSTSGGSLEVTSGTVTLNGPISYIVDLTNKGSLTITDNLTSIDSFSNSGTLVVSGNITSAPPPALPAALNFTITGGTALFSGSISGGAGGVVNISGGTLTLSGDNSAFVNSCFLSGGVLQIASSTSLGGLGITLSGGTLQISNENLSIPAIYLESPTSTPAPSNVSTTLSVDSSLTLTISNLASEPTTGTLTTGTLAFSGEGTIVIPEFSFQPYLSNNFELTISEGVLAGTSALTLYNMNTATSTGVFTLVPYGTNTYTGGTTIGAATNLTINSGVQIGTTSDAITIDADGFLVDNGTIYASSITVDGTLSGSGVVWLPTGENVIVTGSLTPGSSPTLLTINGNLLLNPKSIFNQYIEPGSSASLLVSENVTIESGVTLQINPEPGCYPREATSYSILTANLISGTFEYVNVGSVLLKQNLTYSNSGISLTITPKRLSDIAINGNAHQVAYALDSILNSGNIDLCNLIGHFIPLSTEEIVFSLNQFQPSQLKAFAISQENNAVKVRETLSFRFQRELDAMHCSQGLNESTPCNVKAKPLHIWATGMGDALHQGSPKYLEVGYQENMAGISSGIDVHFAKYLYAGILGAYTSSDVKWQKNQGTGNIQSGYTGLYFSALGKMFYGNASVLGAWSHYDAQRNITLPYQQFTASSKHGGAQILSHLDTGINLGWKGFTVRPFDSFDYISQTENGFTETGANILDLTVKKNTAILLRNELGFNFSKCFCIKGSQWTISPKISWVREVRVRGSQYTAEFVGTEVPFTVTGYFPDRSLVSPGVSLTGNMLSDLLTLEIYYEGEFKGNYSDHSYGGQIRFGF